MTIVLGALAALSWGTGDFCGGGAARHGRATAASAGSQVTGFAAVLVLAPIIGGSPTIVDIAWGAIGGISGGFGLLFLYRGMAVGDIGLVVPVAAIGTGVFPLLFGIAAGDRLGATEATGLALALGSIWLVSYAPGPRRATLAAGILFGVGAGAGFGGLLVALSRIGDDAGIWPLAATRLVGGLVVLTVALIGRQTLKPHAHSWKLITAAGALGVAGNAFFIFASQSGPLAVAAVVGSLFPAVTVVLARLFLSEPIAVTRGLGLATAVIAVALLSLG